MNNSKKFLYQSTLLLITLLISACGTGSESAQPSVESTTTQINVVTTVSPVTNIIHNIAGDRVLLSGIVPEGVNSHTFEPAPSDAIALAKADLIFINGLNLEEPTRKLAEANLKDGAEIVLLGELVVAPNEYLFDFSFPESEGSPNPHLWPNPLLSLQYAEIARDKLSERDPPNAEYYAANYAAFADRINELDIAIQKTVDSIPESNRRLLTYHDSWAYFSPRYGMTVIGAIQPSDFAEPSAQEVADLITQLREQDVPAVFGSEVFPSPVLEQIAKEANVKFVDQLRDDDLPGAPGDPDHSYVGMMAENLRIMAEALGGDPSLIASFDKSNITGTDEKVEQAQ